MGCQGKLPQRSLCSSERLAIIAQMMLPPLAERYLSHLRVEGGLSVNTIEAYRRDLSKFHSYLHRTGVVPLGPLTPDTLRGFLRSCTKHGCLALLYAAFQLFVMAPFRCGSDDWGDPIIGRPDIRGVRLHKKLSQRDVIACWTWGQSDP